MTPILAAIVAIAVLVPVPRSALRAERYCTEETDDFDSLRQSADRAFVERVQELARLAGADTLFEQRDRLCAVVLSLDPENAFARETLGFERTDGSWTQRADHRPGRDYAGDLVYAHRERFMNAYYAYRKTVLSFLESERAVLGEARVTVELERLRDVAPDDPVVRNRLGEVLWRGRWVLHETRAAATREPFVVEAVHWAIETAPEAEPCPFDPAEIATDIPWVAARRTPRVRVVGTVSDGEIGRTAEVVHATGSLFAATFGVAAPYRERYTFHSFTSPEQGRRFLRAWPGVSDELERWLAGLNGGWVEPARAAEWSDDYLRRIDGAARQTVGMLVRDTWGVEPSCGWAWEGVGLYLVHRLLGTRLTWFVEVSEYGYSPLTEATVTGKPGEDWSASAHDLARSDRLPRLPFLISYRSGEMKERELVAAWLLVSYLIEGRPTEVTRILKRVGSGESSMAVLEDELGMPLPSIDERLANWLCETSHGERCPDSGSAPHTR